MCSYCSRPLIANPGRSPYSNAYRGGTEVQKYPLDRRPMCYELKGTPTWLNLVSNFYIMLDSICGGSVYIKPIMPYFTSDSKSM